MLANDPQSLSQHERHPDKDERVYALAKQLPGKVDRTRMRQRPTGDPVRIAFVVCAPDLWTFDMLLDATEKASWRPSAHPTAGKGP